MEHVASNDGTTIAYERSGAGPPLLLVHGTTADHRRWSGIAPQLEQHFTVLAMDRRGRGASTDAPVYDIMREAEDVAAVLEAIGEPALVLAHSYGAVCALESALLTDNIRRMILYEPPVPTGLPLYPPGLPDRMQTLIDNGDLEAALEAFLREVVRMPEHELDAYRRLPMWEGRIRLAPTIPRELAIDRAYRFDPDKFANLRVPTLLLLGGDSPPLFARAIEAVAAALPNSKVISLPGQQHIAMDTNPDLFVSEVLGFLGPFYHGTKADLKPGDLIAPGYRSNYGNSKRTSPWVYMSATLSPWGAELAQGDGPGRIYIVEPTGPFVDDPDLTDKKFSGNPTKSYRSRDPLRVVGEVTDWQPHSSEEINRMTEGRDRMFAAQAKWIAHIPTADDFARLHARADELAVAWSADAEYIGCTLLMLIRTTEVDVFSAMTYRSKSSHATRTIVLPEGVDVQGGWSEGDGSWPDVERSRSGRITGITAWHDGWVAVIESCITEIGLSLETRLWITVDAAHDRLTFRVDAKGPERSWQRNLQLDRGLLTDAEYGEIWDFGTDRTGTSLNQPRNNS